MLISGKLGFPVVQPRLNFLPRVSPLVQPRLNFRAATSAGTCLNSRTVGAVEGGVYLLVGSTCRGSMATLDMDCVHKYIHHIADVSPPKAEYVRYFEAAPSRRVTSSPSDLHGCMSENVSRGVITPLEVAKLTGQLKFPTHYQFSLIYLRWREKSLG